MIWGIGVTGVDGPGSSSCLPAFWTLQALESEQMKQVDWYRKDCSVSCYNSVAPKLRELSIEHEVPTTLMNADLSWVTAFGELAVV